MELGVVVETAREKTCRIRWFVGFEDERNRWRPETEMRMRCEKLSGGVCWKDDLVQESMVAKVTFIL